MQQINKYTKVTEIPDISGVLYEVKIAALLYLRILKQSENFKIASNMKAAGSFDDIVIKLENQIIFLQLKHRKNFQKKIILNQLLHMKGDYSLLKYYKSYCAMKQHWEHDKDLKHCGKFDNSLFVLYTNVSLDDKLGTEDESSLKMINSGGKCICLRNNHDRDIHQLFESLPKQIDILAKAISCNQTKIPTETLKIYNMLLNNKAKYLPQKTELITLLAELKSLGDLADWREFLSKFYFLSKQASENQLDDYILQEMVNVCGSSKFFSNFKGEMEKWWRNENFYLTVKAKFWQNIIKMHADSISKEKLNHSTFLNIQYNQNELDIMRQQLQSTEKIMNIVSEYIDFSCLKIVQSSEIKLYVDAGILKSHLNEVLALWKMGSEIDVLLVEGWKNSTEIIEGFAEVLRTKPNKKLVIVTCNADDKPTLLLESFQHTIKADYFSFSQLDKRSKQRILESEIVFQGNLLQLKSLTNTTIFEKLLNGDTVSRLLTEKHKLKVGEKVSDENEYYFSRIITRNEEVNEQIFHKRENAYFAISGISLEELEQLMPHEIIEKYDKNEDMDYNSCHIYLIDNVTDFKNICEKCINDTTLQSTHISFNDISVHWFQKCEKGFRWKSSCGDIKLIKTNLVQDAECVEYNCLNEIMKQPHKLVLIIADPGMGKSTVLSYFALEFKKKDLSMWIVRINLNEFTDYLSKNEPDAIQILLQAGNFKAKFQEDLFMYHLQNGGNVVVFLDGFDEISPLYSEKVINILEQMLQTNIKSIWITSRPVMREKLEECLCTLSFTLQPISIEDQTQFLLHFWKVPNITPYNCRDFIKELLNLTKRSIKDMSGEFTGFPLHIKLLAEIFQVEALDYLRTGKIPSTLTDTLDVLKLYYRFVDQKWEIFYKKYNLDMTKMGVNENYHKNTFQENHKICALISVFGIEEVKKLCISETIFLKYYDFIEKFEAGCRTGIVTDVRNSTVVFVHRTVAEFFIAILFHENFESYVNVKKENIFTKAFHFILSGVKKTMLNKFEMMDCIKENLLNNEFQNIRNFFNRILTSNYQLHSAVLNRDEATVKSLLSHKTTDINSRDCGGRTALYLAVLSYLDIHFNEKSSRCMNKILSTLMEYGADPTIKDEIFYWRPLYLAVNIKAWYAVAFLTQCKADYRDLDQLKLIIKSDIYVQEILKTAIRNGFYRLLEFMLKNGIHTEYIIKEQIKLTMLHLAVKYGQFDIVKFLVNNKADIEAWDSAGYRNPLMLAAEFGRENIAKFLIEHGASVSVRNRTNGTTALILAAEKGNCNIVQLLIDQDADIVDIRDLDDDSALHYASASGHVNCVSLLVYNGVDINIKNKKLETPLLRASRTGQCKVIDFLLHSGADLSACDKDGNTALHCAAQFGKTECLEYLLNAERKFINKENNNKETPLILAAKNDQKEIVKLLINNGANIKDSCKYGKSLLHLAIKTNDNEYVSYFLRNGIHIDIRDNRGRTPILDASAHQKWNIVKFLIENDADPQIPHKSGGSVFYTAVRYANSKCVSLLLDKGINIDTIYDGEYTPLLKAAYWGNFDMVKLLVQRGANVRAHNKNGDSVLHFAAKFGNADCVSLLVKANKNTVNFKNNSGRTPLMTALCYKQWHVVGLLIKSGTDLTVSDRNGNTVIHYAVKYGYTRIISKAQDAGLSIDVKNNLGQTPLFIAQEARKSDVMQILIDLGADLDM